VTYIDKIVKKPWGYEYLIYENTDVGLWFLHIEKDQCTSMHCHPKKTTGLVLLDGQAEISFLADKRRLEGISKVMIRRGLFHSTKALSDNGAFVLEIETPVDKHDLVRLNDKYGRQSTPYEGVSHEEKKNVDCLWLEEPSSGDFKTYNFANCKLKLEKINDVSIINNKKDDDLIMFLSGGLIRTIDDKFHCVTIPGDVGYGKIVKYISKQLDGVSKDTLILTITKDEI
jgi:hypothetical protein